MKQISILIVAVAIIGGVGYYGWQWNAKQNGTVSGPEKPHNFTATGNLVRNNPGLKPDTWFFIYERPGSPALSVELDFRGQSKCFVGSSSTPCKELNVPNGSRANVEGDITGTKLSVSFVSTETALDTIRVNSPKPNETLVTNTIKIVGEARGSWFFEASFPVRLMVNGQVVTTSIAQAKSDWMTESFVPFEAEINYPVTTTTAAEIVLAADNPSGLPGNDKQITIPVTLQPKINTRSVVLYYYNLEKDTDNGVVQCSANSLEKVQRTIPRTNSPLQDAVKLLLKGQLTAEEKASGLSTEFPLDGVELTSVLSNNGTVTLQFSDPNMKLSGGSCRVGILWSQIEATAKQFAGVKEVKYYPLELFQP